MVGVLKVFRDAAKVSPGEAITVSLEKAESIRSVEVPQDLAEALRKEDLTDAFGKMSFTHQKEYVRAVEEAKREETRLKRIEKTIEHLISKRK